jgi:hypothetical protein
MDEANFEYVFLGVNAPFNLILDSASGIYYVDCAELSSAPNVKFNLEGIDFSLAWYEYILFDGENCILGIQPSKLLFKLIISKSDICRADDMDLR